MAGGNCGLEKCAYRLLLMEEETAAPCDGFILSDSSASAQPLASAI